MQIKIFTVPIWDNGEFAEELNRFLRGHKVLDVREEFSAEKQGGAWTFCVKYLDKEPGGNWWERKGFGERSSGEKKDYREILDEKTFAIFSKLRVIRKAMAAESGRPAFAIFTDEELAGLAQLEKITPGTMLTIRGIGDKKVEMYARRIIEGLAAATDGEEDSPAQEETPKEL